MLICSERRILPDAGAASCCGEEDEVLPAGSRASPSCPQCPGRHGVGESHCVKPKAAVCPPGSWSGCGQGKAESSHVGFFCCLLHFKTVQKDFSLWKRLAMVFSRVHILRTSSHGVLIYRPLGYYFCNRNFNIFTLMLCHFEKKKLWNQARKERLFSYSFTASGV